MDMPKVFIVVLNWNGKADTVECLESLRGLQYPNFKTIVVDNASADDSVEVIKRGYPEIILIENTENLGFSEGNNVAMRYALQNGADYVFLLNNDTVVEPSFLTRIIEGAESDERIGIATPQAYYYEYPERAQDHPERVSFYTGRSRQVRGDRSEEIWETDAAFGACMLVKRKVLEQVGLLSPEYRLGWEDIDYTRRVHDAGMRCVMIPAARIWHKGSVSINKVSEFRVCVAVVNRFVFLARYSSRIQFFCSTLWFAFVETPMSLVAYLRRYRSWKVVAAFARGVWEAMLRVRKLGKQE